MNVSLSPELERFVRNIVARGQYASASEVVRAALRFLQQSQWSSEADQVFAELKQREHIHGVLSEVFKDDPKSLRVGTKRRKSP